MEGRASFREESGRVLLPFASCKIVISSAKFLNCRLANDLVQCLAVFWQSEEF